MARQRLLAVVALLAAGLAPPAAAADGLEDWLESKAIPHLEDYFGRHPRLEGETFVVRAVDDGRVVAEMDGLSAYLRERIIEALEVLPDTGLLRPRGPSPWDSGRSLDALACSRADEAGVRLGVDVRPVPDGESARVLIRAVDTADDTPIEGVTQSWRGRLSASERRRLEQVRTDRSLIGSRSLPFEADQVDLLAARLATDIGCLLRRGGRGGGGLHVAPPPPGTPEAIVDVHELARRYLASLEGVELVDEAEAAATRLQLQLHRVRAGRYQLWTSLGGRGGDFVEASAATYVAVAEDGGGGVANADAADGGADPGREAARGALIEAFELIAPSDPSGCERRAPWADGAVVIEPDRRLSHGDCFAIRFRPAADVTLFLFAQTGNLAVERLLPNDCKALHLGPGGARMGAGRDHHIPRFRDGSKGYFRLDSDAGVEHVHALAVRGDADRGPLAELRTQTADPCRLGGLAGGSGGPPFASRLGEIARRLGDDAVAATRSLIHAPAR